MVHHTRSTHFMLCSEMAASWPEEHTLDLHWHYILPVVLGLRIQ